MAQQYSSSATQLLPDACINDITPPTFAGIQTLVAQANGSLKAGWLTATDTLLPIEYLIYVKEDNDTDIFNSLYLAYITKNLTIDIFQDSFGNLLNNDNYFVGVRAKDAVNNVSNNLQTLEAISNGVIPLSIAELVNRNNELIQITRGVLANAAQGMEVLVDEQPIEVEVENNDIIVNVDPNDVETC